MTDYRTKDRAEAIIRLADKPVMIRELIPAMMIGGQDRKHLSSRLAEVLRELEAEGKIRLVDQVFLKSGSWVQRWEAVQ